MAPVQIKVVYDYYSAKRTTPFFITEEELLNLDFHSFKSRLLLEVPHIAKSTSAKALRLTHRQPKLTPRESEEFINYLWFSSRDVTFERDRYWVTSSH